jgi:hypothetical protein
MKPDPSPTEVFITFTLAFLATMFVAAAGAYFITR